jgi:adenosylcobalamin-dependent ribonucleoside-triphosphate reductase
MTMSEGLPVTSHQPRLNLIRAQKKRYIFEIENENQFRLDPGFLAEYIDQQPAWGYGALSYVTYKRTYARDVPGENRTEEFWETARRVIEGMFSILQQRARTAHCPWDEDEAQEKAQEAYRRMWSFKWLPPGRGLFFMGTEALQIKGGAALNSCGFVSTRNISSKFSQPFCDLMDYSMLGVGMGFDLRGTGKASIVSPERSNDIHVVEDSREGWIEAVRIVLDAHVGRRSLPHSFDFSRVRPEGALLTTFGGIASGPAPLVELLDSLTKLFAQNLGPIKSTTIVAVMNMIGKCVVSGNVRRSSEIALGSPEDEDFISLKDPTEVIEIGERMKAIARRIPEWADLESQIVSLRLQQSSHSVLSAEFTQVQDMIDPLIRRQNDVLAWDKDWSTLKETQDKQPLFDYLWASNNTVLCELGKTDYSRLARQTVTNGEPGYAWLDVIRQHGRLADPSNDSDAAVMGFNPCGEQQLHDMELCCLVETFPTKHDSLKDYLVTLKYAYLYAKVVSLVPTHNPRTNAVMTSNRRIGTSMAGIFEMYSRLGMRECVNWWDTGYRFLRDLDREYSRWLGVNKSIRITSVKPGGTIPLLVGVEGGMKLPIARYYMRTIRIATNSPLVSALRDAGYRVEKDRTTPRTAVVYFPCQAPDGVRTSEDVSLWEQAALFTALQRHWSDNMVSATLTFRPGEENDVEGVLRAYEGQWKCVSFLPLMNHGFLQAPYIPCTETEYAAATVGLKDIIQTLSGSTHEVGAEDKYCSGGVCELPSRRP